MKLRRAIGLVVILIVVGILSIVTIRAIQRNQICGDDIPTCVALAKARGLTEIGLAGPRPEYGDLVELNKVLSYCLIVKAHFLNEIAKPDDDAEAITTYRKYRVEVLHRPSETCASCNNQVVIPKEVMPAEGEMVVPFEGGTIISDGIKVTMEPFESDGNIGKAQNLVLLLFQNVGNPRFGYLSGGPKGAYILRNINGAEFLIVNDGPEYWYAHPLVELFGPMKTRLSFSDFEKKLQEARVKREKT